MRISLLVTVLSISVLFASAQNVFNPADPQVRYDKTKALGTVQNPNPAKTGLQKWVSTPTTGVSSGSTAFNNSSFKAYYININGTRMAFRIKFPYSYTRPEGATKKYPVMLFLHGGGEAGCNTNGGIYNNEKQLWLGGSLFMQRVDNNQFDGFLIYPQLVNTTECWAVWGSTPAANFTAVFAMIDSLAKYARANIDRVLVDGLSGGGYGAWRAASSYPQRIAKIMPSASAGSTSNRTAFVHIPIWFATGGKDPDPTPAQAAYTLTRMKEIGADIRYTQFPDLGHNMWYNHWREPDFVAAMNDMHKANPLIFFQKSDYCSGEAINTKLGITAGFYAYEWQKDGVTIATRTNGVNTIVNGTSIISFAGNEITVKSLGTYRVRFKRSSGSAWSDWSPKPAIIKVGAAAQAPSITIVGLKSKVLPALDGSTTVPLQMPAGYINYEWRRVSDNVKVSSSQTYNAPVGVYKAKYEVRAGCGPGFSPNFTVVNANGTPKPTAATALTLTSLSATSARLNWTQGTGETAFEVYRGTVKGGPYQLLAITAANATTYTDNTLATNTTYYYVVRAVNETGAAAKSNEVSPNGGNTAPVIQTLSNMYIKTDATASKTFSVTDNAGDVVTVSIPAKPPFITLEKLTTTSYRITARPTLDHTGWHDIKVLAVDSKGMSSTKNFIILVANKNTRSVFVNLGASGKTAAAPWNNWLGTRTAGSSLGSLKDENNLTTTFSVTAVSGWSTTTSLGHITGNNSGVVPDAVLQSGIADNSTARQIRIGGLSTSKRYNLVFVGSQNEGIVATTEYATGTQKSVMDARYNTQRTANLNSLTPDANGQILVTATRTGTSPYSYLNAIIIEEYASTVSLLEPENLYAEPVDRTSVQLTWSDKTNNEAPTGGYQLQRATDAAFTLNVVSITLNGNVNSYKNTGLSANTKYWYRVRAKNAGGTYSAFSNKVATITPNAIIYVNFNTTVANGPSPWNNLVASPLAPFTSVSLKNQSGTTTSVTLRLEKEFNGEFTAGVNTGNNSGVAPDNVLKSAYWLDNGQVGQFRVRGLNASRRYRFGFFGSSSTAGWYKGDYTATYSINDRTVYLNSWMNSTKIVYIGDVVPTSAGEVLLNFSTTAAGDWGFNSGILIEDYSDGTGGTVLNSVVDEITDSTTANLLTDAMVYPNPFTDIIQINFNNNSPANRISADLYDVYGRLIRSRHYGNLHAGANNLRFEVAESEAGKGVYLLTLKVNGRVSQTIKLVKR